MTREIHSSMSEKNSRDEDVGEERERQGGVEFLPWHRSELGVRKSRAPVLLEAVATLPLPVV